MQPLATSLDPDLPFRAFLTMEPKLRPAYLRLSFEDRGLEVTSPTNLLEASATLLEIVLVGAFVYEVVLVEMNSSLADVTAETALEIRTRAMRMYGLDPAQVADEARRFIAVSTTENVSVDPSMPAILSAMRAILGICPISKLESLADSHHLEALGHRCRLAYDGIKALVLRNSEGQQISVLGHAYVAGAISVDDIATILGIHGMDVLELLDSYGFSRSVHDLLLGDSSRDEMFERIRDDRLRRQGRPEPSRERIERDVVASERIEGVDARRWISREAL